MSTSTPSTTALALIGLDWGTTSLRAYAYAPGGQVLERRHSPHGITQLPALGEAGFAQALSALVGDWVAASPAVPLVACGMVGSAQGWREAAYVPVPTGLGQLASQSTTVALSGLGGAFAGKVLHILPGLIEYGELPNVMRGEETQIFGALLEQPQQQGRPLVVGLPGTHSKWARVEQGRVVHFDTFMTGEVYAALCNHTILGRTMERGGPLQQGAFERGLRVASSAQGAHGMLGTIFSSRTLGLTKALAPAEQPDYLSGLLIGHEVQALARQWGDEAPSVWLIGDEALCGRYAQALRLHGIAEARWLPQATETGLWHLGQAIAST